jgi:hypothetical protein
VLIQKQGLQVSHDETLNFNTPGLFHFTIFFHTLSPPVKMDVWTAMEHPTSKRISSYTAYFPSGTVGQHLKCLVERVLNEEIAGFVNWRF